MQSAISSDVTTNWSPSELILKLRRDHASAQPALGAERAIHYTEFFKKEARHYKDPHIRLAKAFADHLERRAIRIFDGEIFIGSHTEHRIGAICYPELAGSFMLEDLGRFEKRKTNPLHVDRKHKRKLLLGVMPYWFTRNIVMKAFSFINRIRYSVDQLSATSFIINEAGGVAHFVPAYDELLRLGTAGIKEQIAARKNTSGISPVQLNFLESAHIAVEALEKFAARYRSEAERIGRQDMADMLGRIPVQPATNIREALQTIWLYQALIQIESLDQGISPGRLDQILCPYYLREKDAGTFDADEFRDLLCAFCLKLSEVIPLFSDRLTRYYSGLPTGQAVIIGGLDAQGNCAANELTYLILDVIEKFQVRQPNWHARIGQRSDKRYVDRVMQVVAQGGGSPALYNDDVIMPALEKHHLDGGEGWNYATVGCVEPAIGGKSFTSTDAAIFNVALSVNNILKKYEGGLISGIKNIFRKKHVPAAIEELIAEIETDLSKRLNHLHFCLSSIERSHQKHHPTPFSSITIRGCIESATDCVSGGALINGSGIQAVGLADLADSVAALDDLVFQTKRYTLREIAGLCRKNFKSAEAALARVRREAKFGNDNAAVDKYAARFAQMFHDLIVQKHNTRGGRWTPGLYSMTCHRAFGSHMAALPSGRLKGASLADGIAPSDGSDVLGPTASLASACAVDNTLFANGINLNIKFSSSSVASSRSPEILGNLIGTFFRKGGMQVQINVLDLSVLKDAIMHPEKYRNLLVRVSGYSAYFTDLTPAMQEEIIARTFHSV